MIRIWICLCAFLSCTGWLLSAVHSLNRTGYLVAFAIAIAALLIWRHRTGWNLCWRFNWVKLRRRFCRPFPLAFLVLAALAILGGVLHAPSNYDGLTYRTPRVLHWLAAEEWHWVETGLPRLNIRATGYEWVTAPLIVFSRTDRCTFLISGASFLLLPGLVFSLLHRLGVRGRVAWYWMWLLPTGYTYLLQAGSIGNDLFGAVFGLAAIDFGLRARTSRQSSDVWFSVLAAALVTGSKSSNLLVGVPWLLAIWPALGGVAREPAKALAVTAIAVGVSVIPISFLNVWYCGDWTGQVLEHSAFGGMPLFRLPVNLVGFSLQNFVPPLFPFAGKWNDWVEEALPAGLAEQLSSNFEPGAARFALGEMQNEETAGLGFGVCVLLLISAGCAWQVSRRWRSSPAHRPGYQWQVVLGAWISTFVFMSLSGLSGAVRYLAPLYVLLVVPLLWSNGHRLLLKSGWWHKTCAAVFALAALLLLVNPARPLWPAVTVLRALGAGHSDYRLVQRAWVVYSVYSRRADAFAPVRQILPAEANPLGFVSFDDPETSLWRPFFTRRILHVIASETGADLRHRGMKYVLVSSVTLTDRWQTSLDAWLARVDGERVATVALDLRASTGSKDWYLVRLH